MKRYLLFAGDNFYPGGGWYDFRGSFESGEEATREFEILRQAEPYYFDWFHIVDTETGELV